MNRDDLQLVECRPEYADLWKTWRDQPKTRAFNPISPLSVEILRDRLAEMSSDLSERQDEYIWFIRYKETLIGTVSLKNINRSMKYAEIGYGLDEAWHGRGLGTGAVALLVDKIFSETKIFRLMAYVAEDNIASRRLLEKIGFRTEGVLRQHYIIQGRRVNEVLYAMTKPEWTSLESRTLQASVPCHGDRPQPTQ